MGGLVSGWLLRRVEEVRTAAAEWENVLIEWWWRRERGRSGA